MTYRNHLKSAVNFLALRKLSIIYSMKERKERADKGKERSKYKSDLPDGYREYQGRAARKGLRFELPPATFTSIFEADCVYCGSSSNVINLINDRQGYILDNVQPCCSTCDKMRGALTNEAFLKQIKRIFNHINQ